MTKEFAQFLVEVTENAGNQEIDLREGYSGRGMYGRETCAVVVDNPLQLITDMAQYFKDNLNDREDENGKLLGVEYVGSEIPELDPLRMDSMGRDSVVIY